MEKIIKVFNGEIKEVKDGLVTVYVSTSSVDREKEVILPTAWNLKNYEKHPVLLSSHKYDKLTNQIGKSIASGTDDKGLWMTFEYFTNKGNFEADWGYFLAKQGIASYSVGFIPNKTEPGKNGVKTVYKDVELLEVSQVLVPANPEAVQGNSYEKQYLLAIKSFKEANKSEMGINNSMTISDSSSSVTISNTETKGVIPYKKFPLAPIDTPWSFTAVDGNKILGDPPDWNRYRSVHCWYDSSKPEIRGSYKLPIAKYIGTNIKVVWRGVAAAMAILLGARGGIDVPEADRKGIYNKLAKYYKDFDKEVPEFKEYENDEEIFKACGISEKKLVKKDVAETIALGSLIDHLDFLAEAFENNNVNADDVAKMRQALALLMEVMQSQAVMGQKEFLKSGRVLSAKTVTLLKNTLETLKKAESGIEEILKLGESNNLSLDKNDSTVKDILEGLKKAFSK